MISSDFVIVGAGTAGLALASRLSEDENVSVTVLEAGFDLSTTDEMTIPGFAFKNSTLEDRMWFFDSVPQGSINDRTITYPRGKTLGGSSSINFLGLTRGHLEDYNALETLGNGEQWNWSNLLHYFKKSETYAISPEQSEKYDLSVNPQFHGLDGPIQRTPPVWSSNLDPVFFEGMALLGVKRNTDVFNGNATGTWVATRAINSETVTRSSAVTGYYDHRVKSRTNLKILERSQAIRILFEKDGSGKVVARGVEYQDLQTQTRRTIVAKREVILAAGAFQTPQLLELSGVGERNILERHGIDLVVDLPGVGNGLQDHIWASYSAEVHPDFETKDIMRDPKVARKELETYNANKTGMLGAGSAGAFAYLSLSGLVGPEMVPHFVELAEKSNSYDSHSKVRSVLKSWLETDIPQVEFSAIHSFTSSSESQAPEPGKRYLSFLLGLQHMFGRGSVHISSADPFKPPAIDPNVLKEEVDLEILVNTIKYIRKLMATPVYEDVVIQEAFPGLQVQSDEDIRKYVRDTANTIHHPISTAAMLPLGDGGVVDPELKVYGTSNLRVVDASIIPIHMTGHIQTTVYAIAEKAADMIKKARGDQV